LEHSKRGWNVPIRGKETGEELLKNFVGGAIGLRGNVGRECFDLSGIETSRQ
jgi:hypothetical protein